MKASYVVGGAVLAGLALYLYSRNAAAAALAPSASASSAGSAPASSSGASELTMPAPSLQSFALPSLSEPSLSTVSLSPISVNVSPLPLASLNIMGPGTGATPSSFWAGLTPAPMFSSNPFASSIEFPSGEQLPLSSASVRIDANGNGYIMQGGQVYQLTGPSGGSYAASLVTLS